MTSQSNFPPRLPSLAEPLCSHFDARCTSLIVIHSADLAAWVFALRHFLVEQQGCFSESCCMCNYRRVNKQTRRRAARSGNEKIRAAHKTNL
jgi:hypothetical protein